MNVLTGKRRSSLAKKLSGDLNDADPTKDSGPRQAADTPLGGAQGLRGHRTMQPTTILSSALQAPFDLALKTHGHLPAAKLDLIAADLDLNLNYCGQYVAWIDVARTVDNVQRLYRTVLAHAPEYDEIEGVLDVAFEEHGSHLRFNFIEPLQQPADACLDR